MKTPAFVQKPFDEPVRNQHSFHRYKRLLNAPIGRNIIPLIATCFAVISTVDCSAKAIVDSFSVEDVSGPVNGRADIWASIHVSGSPGESITIGGFFGAAAPISGAYAGFPSYTTAFNGLDLAARADAYSLPIGDFYFSPLPGDRGNAGNYLVTMSWDDDISASFTATVGVPDPYPIRSLDIILLSFAWFSAVGRGRSRC